MTGFSDKDKAEYYHRCYKTVDGLWFVKTEQMYDFDSALEIDREVWNIMPKIQARFLKKKLEAEVAKRPKQIQLVNEKIKATTLETIIRLSRAAEYRDEETGSHIQRISRYAVAVARQMGFDEHFIETILYALPMHEIGKIGVPDYILLKMGKLESHEW